MQRILLFALISNKLKKSELKQSKLKKNDLKDSRKIVCEKDDKAWVQIQEADRERLQKAGLRSFSDFLNLDGDILSGHPDRHVREIELSSPSESFHGYLKRQHRVPTSEKLLNLFQGFGFRSKSIREAELLLRLEPYELGARVVAWGENRTGQSFVLVEECKDFVFWSSVYQNTDCEGRSRLFQKTAETFARMHELGFDPLDLYVKHLLVDPRTLQIKILDWQRGRYYSNSCRLPLARKVRSISSFLASLPKEYRDKTEIDRFIDDYWFSRDLFLRQSEPDSGLKGQFDCFKSHIGNNEGDNENSSAWRNKDVLAKKHRFRKLLLKLIGAMQNTNKWLRLQNEFRQELKSSETSERNDGVASSPRLRWFNPRSLEDSCTIASRYAEIFRKYIPEEMLYDPSAANRYFSLPLLDRSAHVFLRNSCHQETWRSYLDQKAGKRFAEIYQSRVLFHLAKFRIPAVQMVAFGKRQHRQRKESFLLWLDPFYRQVPNYQQVPMETSSDHSRRESLSELLAEKPALRLDEGNLLRCREEIKATTIQWFQQLGASRAWLIPKLDRQRGASKKPFGDLDARRESSPISSSESLENRQIQIGLRLRYDHNRWEIFVCDPQFITLHPQQDQKKFTEQEEWILKWSDYLYEQWIREGMRAAEQMGEGQNQISRNHSIVDLEKRSEYDYAQN